MAAAHPPLRGRAALLLSALAAQHDRMEAFHGAAMEPPALADSPYKWTGKNATVHIAGQSQLVAQGSQLWRNSSGALLGT